MATVYLYPDSNLTLQDLTSKGATGYQAIDDPHDNSDGDSTYLTVSSYDNTWKYGEYKFDTLPYNAGSISKVIMVGVEPILSRDVNFRTLLNIILKQKQNLLF